MIFAGEYLSTFGILCILIISCSIIAISFTGHKNKRLSLVGIIFALGAAPMIASYTISDGIGVRLSESPFGFIAWRFAMELPVVAFVAHRRRGRLLHALKFQWKNFLGCAICSVFAYSFVIYASIFIPLAIVSALRETSVIFATLIGVFLLKEQPRGLKILISIIISFAVIGLVSG